MNLFGKNQKIQYFNTVTGFFWCVPFLEEMNFSRYKCGIELANFWMHLFLYTYVWYFNGVLDF